jgi:hypothetical protein
MSNTAHTLRLAPLLLAAALAQTAGRAAPPPAQLTLQVAEGSAEPFVHGTQLFSDRTFTALVIPAALEGAQFLRTSIDSGQSLVCLHPGTLFAITPAAHPVNSLAADLRKQGFEPLHGDPVQLFGTQPADKALIFKKDLSAGETLQTRKWVILLAQGSLRLTRPKRDRHWATNDGQTLPNGIRLPKVWPPRYGTPDSDEPMETPYLEAPPAVLPIDTGRQLLIDDFLIADTTLKRTFHTAKKFEGNPVFKPTTPLELKEAVCYLGHGGVFYDPTEHLIKMWYSAGDLDGAMAFATSRDAFTWERPELGLPAGENLILPRGGRTRGTHAGGDNCLWLDTLTTNAAARIKFLVQRDSQDPHWLAVSSDNRTWSPPLPAGRAGDYCSFFFNPFRTVWVYSVKRGGARGRNRYYAESPDFLTEGAFNNSVYWCNADRLDEQDPVAKCPPQLYSLNAVAYESLMLGIFYIHLGPSNEVCDKSKVPKITELKLGFSRDGFHWERPDRRAFIPASRTEGTWDRAYLHSTAGVCLIDGDRLLFPYCGFSGIAPDGRRGMYYGASVGLAMLRRDGFASMDADEKGGTLTTRSVIFRGTHLFVNAACASGELRAEVLGAEGHAIAPFTLANSKPFSADKTLQRLEWNGATDLAALSGKPVRIRFHLTNGSLYAFWVSPSATGASCGYLAAGALGQPGIIDNP